MTWYKQIDERLDQLRSTALTNQHKLRDDLFAIRNRLIANDLPFQETTYTGAESLVRTFTKLVSTQPDANIVFVQDQYGTLENQFSAISDTPPDDGDIAITEWLRFQIDNLTSDAAKAAIRALKLSQTLPLVGILIFPQELFRFDYRKELSRIRSEEDQTRRRLADLQTVNRKRERGKLPAEILKFVYAYPSAALDSALGLMDQNPSSRSKKSTPKVELWKAGISKRIDSFDKTMQRNGLMPHTKDIEMETYYNDKLHKLSDEREKLLKQLSDECKEALEFFNPQQQLSS